MDVVVEPLQEVVPLLPLAQLVPIGQSAKEVAGHIFDRRLRDWCRILVTTNAALSPRGTLEQVAITRECTPKSNTLKISTPLSYIQ